MPVSVGLLVSAVVVVDGVGAGGLLPLCCALRLDAGGVHVDVAGYR